MARCPTCKEPVSQFAAGCSYCGTDLAVARKAAEARRARYDRIPSLPALGDQTDLLVFGGCLLIVLFFPLAGVLISGYAVYANSLTSQRPLRIGLGVLIAIGVAFLLIPAMQYGIVSRL